LQENLDQGHYRLEATYAMLTKRLANIGDSGIKPWRTLVRMIESDPSPVMRKRVFRTRLFAILSKNELGLEKANCLLKECVARHVQ